MNAAAYSVAVADVTTVLMITLRKHTGTVHCVGVINEDKATVELVSVTTEITVEDKTVIVATNHIYQGVAAS